MSHGRADCRDPRCTRMTIEGETRCVGYHCAKCDRPSSMYGHCMAGRYVDGEFRAFKDGQVRFSCQPGFEEAEVE